MARASWSSVRRPTKYGNKKTVVDGLTFDSRLESQRYVFLRILLKAGQIRNLSMQVSFAIVVNGQKICVYNADFVYERLVEGTWTQVVEDCKSPASITPVYRVKNKLMRAVHGITIQEVTAKDWSR